MPRDIWRQPPPPSDKEEGGFPADETTASSEERPEIAHPQLKAQPSSAADEAIRRLAEHARAHLESEKTEVRTEDAIDDYMPRHRAPGRAPIFRKPRRDEPPSAPLEPDHERPAPPRWTTEGPTVVPPPDLPPDDAPILGLSRAEQRRRDKVIGRESLGPDAQAAPRTYRGRHLAPKKRWLWTTEEGHPQTESDEEPADDAPRDELAAEAAPEAPAVEAPEERGPRVPIEEVADAPAPPVEPREPEPHAAQDAPAPVPAAETIDLEQPDEIVMPDAGAAAPPGSGPEAAEAEVAPVAEVGSPPEAEAAPVEQPEMPAAVAAAESGTAARSETIDDTAPSDGAIEGELVAVDPEAETIAPEAETIAELAPVAAPAPPPPPEILEFEGEDEDLELDLDEELDDLPEGPRKAALRKRRRRRKLMQVGVVVLAALGLAGVGVLANEGIKNLDDDKRSVKVAGPAAKPPEETITTLVFGARETSDGRTPEASWLVLVTVDPESEKGSVVYVPAHTAAEVPGRGLQALGDAYRNGGVPLLLVTTENLLGIPIDRYLELSDKDARVLFEATGNIAVDVPGEIRVPAGSDQTRLVMVSGLQDLGPQLLVKLLYLRGVGGDDVDLGSRHLAFWDALLDRFVEPEGLSGAIRSAGGALSESDATAEEHSRFFASLASLPAGSVTITTLPVTPASAGDSELYGTNAEELEAFLADVVGKKPATVAEVRVQVLNGNGVPGIGQEVAERLIGEGFRIILGGNARRLNYRRTLIVTYDSSPDGLALAERARDLLGVGEVQVSGQPQGIVDLTIVVGKDFLRAR